MNNIPLLFAAFSSFLAALLHIGCIIFGAPWYRFLGATEEMALMAEAGRIEPAVMTSAIAGVLCFWGAYALSGAGVIRRLPFLKTVIFLIAIVLIGRGIAFPLIMSMFPNNSLTFWLVSSTLCVLMGGSYAYGGWILRKQQAKH
ncbi:hypothetical protein [Pseudoalteromonas sp. Of7M-16]|uniref:hypothetical protein n=1 Tax=Pseudoalteromonas sp. Of7M-16 TaxID=2917756 RepID=UPI001EF604E6|nr:hypothetical protein [Pseudoalteromonas sp. Of7M-16]MCG7549963.1 hypothetical protein [Pseudoalteromonas sp. Of7M-16]